MRELTTTSYALLAHLAVRSWSAYDLAQQMTRGLDVVWPRAAAGIYEEPKNLAAHGLARARRERVGNRTRTIYQITPRGRRALGEWLGRESAPPRSESEALLKVIFGEQGTKAQLLGTIRGVAADMERLRARHMRQLQGYLDRGGPFPERWHVIGVGVRALLMQLHAWEEWARWAEAEVKGWRSTRPQGTRGAELIREAVERYGPPPEDVEEG